MNDEHFDFLDFVFRLYYHTDILTDAEMIKLVLKNVDKMTSKTNQNSDYRNS